MGTFVAVIIILWIIGTISEWLEDHKYFAISAVVVIAVLIFGGWRVALGVGVFLLAVRYIGPKLVTWYSDWDARRIQKHETQLLGWLNETCGSLPSITADMLLKTSGQVSIPDKFKQWMYPGDKTYIDVVKFFVAQVQKEHQDQFLTWLMQNCQTLGSIPEEEVFSQSFRVSVPEKFKQYSYPDAVTYRGIFLAFLQYCNKMTQEKVENQVYFELSSAGMMSESDLEHSVIAKCGRFTHSKALHDFCSAATEKLICQSKIDRPIKDHQEMLHCIGATSGSNFESEELSIEI